MIRNSRATQFRPGESGNPGGRPKGIARLAREHALQVLVDALDHPNPRVRLTAAVEVLNRGYGKPVAMIADIFDPFEDFTGEELVVAIELFRKEMAASKVQLVECREQPC
jgi:HEAT repeat protein